MAEGDSEKGYGLHFDFKYAMQPFSVASCG